MNMMVSAAAMTTVSKQVEASPIDQDAELIGLSEGLIALIPTYEAAARRADELYDQLHIQMPVRDDILRWRIADPVSYEMEDLPNGKVRLWCSLRDIERQRRVRQMNWEFIGTDEQAAAITGDESQFDGTNPRSHIAHLYRGTPNKRGQTRLNKLIAALDQRKDTEEALRRRLGLVDAIQAADKVSEPLFEMLDRIEVIQPTSIDGVRAKAKVLVKWHWRDDSREQAQASEDILMHSIVDALASHSV